MHSASGTGMPKDDTSAALPAHHILLVEDYPANVLVATSYLELFGYSYDVASDGLEAVRKATTCRYDAILMDVQMEGINGFEATGQIREHEQKMGKYRVPIIGMTAHALAGDSERCIASGMDAYLSKPFKALEFKELLHNYTQQASAMVE
jgi:CheY-like chemotaxis protein